MHVQFLGTACSATRKLSQQPTLLSGSAPCVQPTYLLYSKAIQTHTYSFRVQTTTRVHEATYSINAQSMTGNAQSEDHSINMAAHNIAPCTSLVPRQLMMTVRNERHKNWLRYTQIG